MRTNKLQNKIKQQMYRPSRKKENENLNQAYKSLEEIEKTLNESIAGIFGKKTPRKRETDKGKDKEKE